MIIKEDQGPKPDVRCFAALSGGLCGSTCARRSKRILLASNSKSGLDDCFVPIFRQLSCRDQTTDEKRRGSGNGKLLEG